MQPFPRFFGFGPFNSTWGSDIKRHWHRVTRELRWLGMRSGRRKQRAKEINRGEYSLKGLRKVTFHFDDKKTTRHLLKRYPFDEVEHQGLSKIQNFKRREYKEGMREKNHTETNQYHWKRVASRAGAKCNIFACSNQADHTLHSLPSGGQCLPILCWCSLVADAVLDI